MQTSATHEISRPKPALRTATWSDAVARAYDHDRPVIHGVGYTWTGRELLDHASGGADWLDSLGLAPGEPVPALLATSAQALALLIGGAGSRHPIAPLGVRMTAHEIAAVLTRLGTPLIVAQPEFVTLAREVAEVTGPHVAVAVVDEVRTSTRALAAHPDDLALTLHTSGTTGAPKLVPIAQWQLATRAAVNGMLCEYDPDSYYGATAPFHHVAGVGNISVALAAGTSLTGVARFSTETWEILKSAGITHTTLVPAMLEAVLAAGSATHSGLRNLQYGGAPIRAVTLARTYEAMPGVRMINMYGQTEGSPLTVLTPEDHRLAMEGRAELLRSVGRPAPWTEIRIVDADANGIGEVWARADHMFVVDDEGWRHSGDMGHIADDGYVYLSGRHGEKIIRGGENVYPLEVEHALSSHPGVVEVAVCGVPDERLGQAIAAFVVARDAPSRPDPGDLKLHVRRQLSGYKVPTHWYFLDALPRNAAGKILRRNLLNAAEHS